jgi:hypothetical protein
VTKNQTSASVTEQLRTRARTEATAVDVDRLVAGAFFFRQLTAAQWDEYVNAKVALRKTPDALVDELEFVAELVERDR